MANLIDRTVEGRMAYIQRLEAKVKKAVSGDVDEDYRKLIAEPLEKARGIPYFDDKHAAVSGKPFTWGNLSVIPEIAGIRNIHHHTLAGQIEQVKACVDNYFRMLLEPIASMPFFYADPAYDVEPNCVGASQIVSRIYGYEHPIDDLEMLVVNSSKRRDILLDKLRNFDKLPGAIVAGERWVSSNFDAFSKDFREEELRDKLLDQVLLIEESNHVVVKKRGGEVFDFPIERDNIKRHEVCGIREGLWVAGVSSLIALYQYLNQDVESQWKEIRNRVGEVSKSARVTVDYSLGRECFDELREIFGEDLPARYVMVELSSRRNEMDFVRYALDRVRREYPYPKALEVIGKRYLGEEGYGELAAEILKAEKGGEDEK
ncbi:MAG: hypothetical protein Q8Q31_00465 [Nanoarchaeota archaeon]|nr:hypothetical protein [Nanoarchaeota archaeon]